MKPGDVCYDIGGYKGYFSGIFSINGASVVHVFEPFPDNINKIKNFLSFNPNLNINLNELAISDKVGETVFRILPNASMGKISASTFEVQSNVDTIVVKTETLDNLIFNYGYPPPDVVKIDVEGAEEFVLKGALKFLTKYRPLLFVEVHSYDLGKTCQTFLGNLGYSVLVMETNKIPNFKDEPPVSHYICKK
jgi:FkbM family methyltransferase